MTSAKINKENNQCIASWALFGELYDEDKNVYNVIADFLRYVIFHKGKRSFNLTEISQCLNETFSFKIPDAVVKTALKSLRSCGVELENKLYTVTGGKNQAAIENVAKKYEEAQEGSFTIINELFDFVVSKKQYSISELSEGDKKDILDALCAYLLDGSSSKKYIELISSFLIARVHDTDFERKVRLIKEGVIIYSGLQYDININNLGSWNEELTIFLDTEILFYACEYNGILFKTLFDDFYSLVKEINNESQRKNNGKKIHLKYFKETKDEIEKYFKKAEYIVRNNEKIDPAKTAMVRIVNGAKTPSDIVAKKTLFYEKIHGIGISLETECNYYKEEKFNFNLEDSTIIDEICGNSSTSDRAALFNSLKLLSHINVLRKGNSAKGLENVGFIFMTATGHVSSLASHPKIINYGEVPLATSLDFMTDRFWFKLNKGFGGTNYPKSFDIITKAQIILSFRVNKAVSKKFEELQQRVKDKNLTEKEIAACLVSLRKQAKSPEDIANEADTNDVLSSISEERIEILLREQSLKEKETEKQREENELLKKELKEKEEDLQRKTERVNIYEREEAERRQKEEKKIEKKRKIKGVFFDCIFYGGLLAIIFIIFWQGWVFGVLTFLGALGGVILLKRKVASIKAKFIK